MNALLHSRFADAFGWMLLHSLWQLTLMAALWTAALALLRRASANARYLLASLGLLLMLLIPILTYAHLLPSPSPTLPSAVAPTPIVVTYGTGSGNTATPAQPLPPPPYPSKPPAPSPPRQHSQKSNYLSFKRPAARPRPPGPHHVV